MHDVNMLDVIARAAEKLAALFAVSQQQGRDMVLLGRDMWPVCSVMRAIGLPVKYFHWSRRQLKLGTIEHASTVAQWIKEIKPGAVVVDSGFHGSILSAIHYDVDETIIGILLCLDKNPDQFHIPDWPDLGFRWTEVQVLEDLPKPTGRCVGYTKAGVALFDKDDKGKAVADFKASQAFISQFAGIKVCERQIEQIAPIIGATVDERSFGEHHYSGWYSDVPPGKKRSLLPQYVADDSIRWIEEAIK